MIMTCKRGEERGEGQLSVMADTVALRQLDELGQVG